MGSPRIKIYELPSGFSEDADTDIQYHAADELLPVVPKVELLVQVKTSPALTGIVPVRPEPAPKTTGDLICFDQAGGAHVHPLTLNTAQPGYFTVDDGGVAWADLLWEPIGNLGPVFKDADSQVIPASEYTVNANGVEFSGNSLGITVTAYHKAAVGASSTFAFLGDTFYRGTNGEWNYVAIQKDGGAWTRITAPDDGVGYITVASVGTDVKARYAYSKAKTRWFIAEHSNWVGGHLRMWPDVFVGETDYPGDRYIDAQGAEQEPGNMPAHRDVGTYVVNFREGMVEFPAEIDGNAAPVKVNYAYLANIANVTSQVLDPVAGSNNTQYRAQSEAVFADSHGKRWVGRDDDYTPINIYVDGELTPKPTTVPLFDALDVKMS